MTNNSFCRVMLEEKGLMNEVIEVEHENTTHFFETKVIIDLIEKAPPNEKKTITNTFSLIDFKNGDLLHYLKHLAKCYLITNYSRGA